MPSFFVSCPLQLEDDLILEIESFWFEMCDLDGLPTREPLPEFTKEQGGLEFDTSLHLGLQINFFSKIANRVLLRVTHFESRYFDQFQKNFEKIEFEKYFDLHSIKVQVESSKSRLFHEDNLLEAIENSLAKKKIKVVDESIVTVFIRIHKDKVMVSLDTSGEHLHFRGYRKQQGEAPMRENLAYDMLFKAGLTTVAAKTILDPFAGSGTLLFEGSMNGYPNFLRDYAFLHLKNTPGLFKSDSWMKNFRWLSKNQKSRFIGFEIDSTTHQKSLQNKAIFEHSYRASQIEFKNADSSKVTIDELSELIDPQLPLWIVTNPPYGERLKQTDVGQILLNFESVQNLQGVVVVHPKDWRFGFKKLRLSHAISFSNQGLKLQLSIYSNSPLKTQ